MGRVLGTRQRLVIIAYIYDVKQQSGDMWGVVTMVVTGFLNVSSNELRKRFP